LVVGVGNDAVNFLTSAMGSKAVSFRVILVVSSIGVLIGAVFSSGMMEIARKGIFHPGLFHFDEIMYIFTAVMLANILLLDFFNSLGLPTSTTVSIVFNLLGAAACIALLKIYTQSPELTSILDYINTAKVTEIGIGILLSVIIAFTLGALVQYFSRLVFSFQFEKKIKYVGAVFGGISLSALMYFILLKGLNDLSFVSEAFIDYLTNHIILVLAVSVVFWTIISQLIMSVFKIDILKVIIVVGTFALALSYAGNDLVNFIGVPIAAWQS